METPGDRLRRARTLAGYDSASDAAKAVGVPLPTYIGHENGSRGMGRQAVRYAAFFRVDLTWLMTGKGGAEGINARFLALSPEGQRLAREMFDLIEQRDRRR